MNKNITIKELHQASQNHPYYCSESNYYSNDPAMEFPDFPSFMAEFSDADVDMNLCFRWDLASRDPNDNKNDSGIHYSEEEMEDIKEQIEEHGHYYLNLFLIQQRKGIFKPIYIVNFEEKDIPEFIKYLEPHISKLKELWKPFEF